MKLRRVLVLAACMVFLTAGLAQAATVNIGGSWSNLGGGSFTGATLNGNSVPWMYCTSYGTTISGNTNYNATLNTIGEFNNTPITGAGQVAWLLTNYGSYLSNPSNINTNNTIDAHALQAAIWTITEGFNPYTSSDPEWTLYQTLLTASSGKTAPVSNFYWITPYDSAGKALQPLVTPTPIPAAAYLFGSGLAGLVGIARFRRKRSK